MNINIDGDWTGNISIGKNNTINGEELPDGVSVTGFATPHTEVPETKDQPTGGAERVFTSPVNEKLISSAKRVFISGAVNCTFTLTEPESVKTTGCVNCKIIVITENPTNILIQRNADVNTSVKYQNPTGEDLSSPGEPTSPKSESPATTFSSPDGRAQVSVGGKVGGHIVIGDNKKIG
jgi:hypothetical protein